jgi:hypothetical protein
MTRPQHASLDEQLPGLQLAVFEVIWPAFRWIKSIWIKECGGQFEVFVEETATQDEKEWNDFDYLIERVFNAGEKLKVRHTVQHGLTVPQDRGYRELMSDRVFEKIAKRHAPWRLDGR